MTMRNVWKTYSYLLIGLLWGIGLTLALTFGFVSSLRHLLWMAAMPHAPFPPMWLWTAVAMLGWALIFVGYRATVAVARYREQHRLMLETLAPLIAPLPFPIPVALRGTAAWHIVRDSGERFAFTWGVRRCHIAVSESLWQALDNPARVAVIYHEAAHAIARDPLQQVVLQALSEALPLFGMRLIYQRYLIRREINADAVAIAASEGDEAPLLSALKAAVDFAVPMVSHVGLADALDARLDYIETRYPPPVLSSGLWLRLMASSAAILLTIGEGWLVWCHF